jgi:hypothetical protein
LKRAVALILLVFALGGCAIRTARVAPLAPVAAEVAVTRAGDVWTATFHFPQAAPAWVFARSSLTRAGALPWREGAWRVETAGVRLERRGHYDMLVGEAGGPVPADVRIAITPFAQELLTDSTPAIRFSSGAIALFSEQFDLFAMPDLAAADALPIDISGDAIPYTRTRVTFRDAAGPILYAGRRVASVGLDDDDGTYILFGPAVPVLSHGMATIIDPALPAWLRAMLLRTTPAILAHYQAELGPAPGLQPMLMVSWAGATPRRTSMRGSTLTDLLAMTFEGEGVLHDNPRIRERTLWFLAHETAHFWLGQAVAIQYARDAWISEGGADLLAIRTVAAVAPDYDWRGALQTSIDDCARLATGQGIAGAEERGEERAFYACGVVFGLVAEGASHRPFSAFVRRLVDSNRDDRVLTREEWLAALGRVSHDPTLGVDIAHLLDTGDADAAGLIASLFRRAGVAFTRTADGGVRLG